MPHTECGDKPVAFATLEPGRSKWSGFSRTTSFAPFRVSTPKDVQPFEGVAPHTECLLHHPLLDLCNSFLWPPLSDEEETGDALRLAHLLRFQAVPTLHFGAPQRPSGYGSGIFLTPPLEVKVRARAEWFVDVLKSFSPLIKLAAR